MFTVDFLPNLAAMEEADAVLFCMTAMQEPLFLKQFSDYGLKSPLMVLFPTALTTQGLQEAGETALGVMSQAPWSRFLDTPENNAFVEAFTKKNGTPPVDTVEWNYQATRTFLEAVKITGGDTSPEVINDAMRKVDAVSPRGRVVASTSNWLVSPRYIMQVMHKQGEYVWDIAAKYDPETRQLIK